jgi:hypothetical protein
MVNLFQPKVVKVTCASSEERFKKLMERIKYEWENFEV